MKPLRIAIRSFADFQSALAAQIAAYRELHPEVEVEVVAFDLPSLEDAVLGANGLRAGEWDLAIFPTDWIGSAINSWYHRKPHSRGCNQTRSPIGPKVGQPASASRSATETTSTASPGTTAPNASSTAKTSSKTPKNKKAFAAQFGRELKPPITWQEFHETARFFTRPSQSLYGTLFAAYPDGHNTLYDLVLQVWSRGGELYTADGLPTLNHPTVDRGARLLSRHNQRSSGLLSRSAHKIDSISSGDVFLSGQIAMMANWFGFAARSSSPESPLQRQARASANPRRQTRPNGVAQHLLGDRNRHRKPCQARPATNCCATSRAPRAISSPRSTEPSASGSRPGTIPKSSSACRSTRNSNTSAPQPERFPSAKTCRNSRRSSIR